MGRLAKNEIYFGNYIALRETLREIDNIKKSDVDEISNEIFKNPAGIPLTILGKIDKKHVSKIWKN